MLAEFADTDVNIQDEQGRTALHWACAESLADMVRLCLSVRDFATGLRDNDGLTAFDIALRSGDDFLPSLFYSSMFENKQSSPQVALLRVLTLSSDETRSENQPLFPGAALFQPVDEHNSPLVVALLEKVVVLTTKDEHSNPALHIAAGQLNNVDIVTRLVQAGSDINAIGNRGSTPLHSAVRTADAEMVQLLLHKHADVAITDDDEMSALHLAAESGRLDFARILVYGGADVHARDSHGRSVVEVAKANRKVEIVEFLASRDKLPDHVLTGPRDLPPDVRVFKLSQSGTGLRNPDYSNMLLEAARQGDLGAVRALLSEGADTAAVDRISYTALHRAAKGGHTEIVKCLLAHGANTEASAKDGITALHSATQCSRTGTVEALLAGGAEIEAYTTSSYSSNTGLLGPYAYAVFLRLYPLLAQRVNWCGGMKALHMAVSIGDVGIVEILVAARARLEEKDTLHRTPLHLAAEYGQIAVVRILLAAGAKLAVEDCWNRTPVHAAAENGYTEIVQILLSAGAKVTARNHAGETAYQLALGEKDMDIVKILGAHTSAINRLRNRLRPRAWTAYQSGKPRNRWAYMGTAHGEMNTGEASM